MRGIDRRLKRLENHKPDFVEMPLDLMSFQSPGFEPELRLAMSAQIGSVVRGVDEPISGFEDRVWRQLPQFTEKF